MEQHRCLVCGKAITWSFALCTGCEEEHGPSALQWPAWLNYLWNEEQRERRRQRKVGRREISVDTDQMDDLILSTANGRKISVTEY